MASIMKAQTIARSSILRNVLSTQRRSIVQSAVDKPNEVKKVQDAFNANPHLHGADNPTYLKQGTKDSVTNSIGGLIVFMGMSCAVSGLYSMSYGINKKS
mmetsp:Transcript_26836/g.35249  ORF Transcript_26836/g.35249 Transcript_26836/m.35249 type:complete len:100 (+) Transcript_26836:74-373(+)|eukprot:CAMPEP_0117752138 /NCGR_PEP_ID=MMETSP0947-20121206/11428_1 /TAXON_ID=44440 /ORGANISM="Chattonella subsalsa, Strain CCMP2191" /LENGTH=99 /DNA_ID=CAMNT_0005570725 /DNA_START=72 /DNA_END=371 /DNA_ORIENTATION=+